MSTIKIYSSKTPLMWLRNYFSQLLGIRSLIVSSNTKLINMNNERIL